MSRHLYHNKKRAIPYLMRAASTPRAPLATFWVLLAEPGSGWISVIICMGLFLLCLTGCTNRAAFKEARLTTQYGAELQAAYENYKRAVAIAYETGDALQLPDVATGYELWHRTETADTEGARAVAEAWRVEIISVTVTEYVTDTAELYVSERIIGNIPDISESDRRQFWICRLERENGVWKVSSFASPDWEG